MRSSASSQRIQSGARSAVASSRRCRLPALSQPSYVSRGRVGQHPVHQRRPLQQLTRPVRRPVVERHHQVGERAPPTRTSRAGRLAVADGQKAGHLRRLPSRRRRGGGRESACLGRPVSPRLELLRRPVEPAPVRAVAGRRIGLRVLALALAQALPVVGAHVLQAQPGVHPGLARDAGRDRLEVQLPVGHGVPGARREEAVHDLGARVVLVAPHAVVAQPVRAALERVARQERAQRRGVVGGDPLVGIQPQHPFRGQDPEGLRRGRGRGCGRRASRRHSGGGAR